jgi:hypothetical protein
VAKRPKRGFQEYVKNPDLFREEAREADRASVEPAPGDDRLAALVTTMYTSRPEYEVQFYRDLHRRREAVRCAQPSGHSEDPAPGTDPGGDFS